MPSPIGASPSKAMRPCYMGKSPYRIGLVTNNRGASKAKCMVTQTCRRITINRLKNPSHPNEVLAELYPNIQIECLAITTDLAQQLAELTNTTFEFWMNLQTNYDNSCLE